MGSTTLDQIFPNRYISCFFDAEKAKPNPLMYRVIYVKYLLDKLAKLKLI